MALFVCVAVVAQEKSKYAAQLDVVFKAFETKDHAAITPVLAKGFTISNMPAGFEKEILPQVVPQFNGYTSYTVLSETEEKGGTRVKINAKNPAMKCNVDMNFLFDSENKIKELNILEAFSPAGG